MKNINDVKKFWEENPLFVGESSLQEGTELFFKEHTNTYISDCFPGEFDDRCFPMDIENKNVLDLGCGSGCIGLSLYHENPKIKSVY